MNPDEKDRPLLDNLGVPDPESDIENDPAPDNLDGYDTDESTSMSEDETDVNDPVPSTSGTNNAAAIVDASRSSLQRTNPEPSRGGDHVIDTTTSSNSVESDESNGAEEQNDVKVNGQISYVGFKRLQDNVLFNKPKKGRNLTEGADSIEKSGKSSGITRSVQFVITSSGIESKHRTETEEDSETDSPDSGEESDHFKDKGKVRKDLEALRSDCSSSEISPHLRSYNNTSSYGSIQLPNERKRSREEACRSCCAAVYSTSFVRETKALFLLAVPLILVQFFQHFLAITALIFCGHLSIEVLNGVSLAVTIIHVCATSTANGLATACDTVFSHLVGSGEHDKLIVVFQKALIILLLATVPSITIILNIETIFLWMNQNPEASRIAADYLLIFIPGLLCYFAYIVLARVLQNHDLIIPLATIGFAANVCNCILQYVLIHVCHMQTRGSAVALTISYVILFILTCAYLRWSCILTKSWNGWSSECLQSWGPFSILALSGMVMTILDWWVFLASIFIVGALSDTMLSTQTVLVQIDTIAYMIPLGISMAVNIQIGHKLGAENSQAAKSVMRVALSISAVFGIVLGTFIYILKDFLPYIFTSDSEIVTLGSQIIPVVALYVIFESIVGIGGWALRGCGRLLIGASIMVIGHLIALGAAIYLLLDTSLGLYGFWIPFAGITLLEAIVTILVAHFTNWSVQIEKLKVRGRNTQAITSSKSPGYGFRKNEREALLAAKEKDFTASYDHYYSKDMDFHASYEAPAYSGYSGGFSGDNERENGKNCGLEKWQLVLRRGSVILLMIGILTAGIILRLYSENII